MASNYKFSLNAQAMNAILLTVVWLAGIKKIQIQFKKEWIVRILSASVAVFAIVYVGLQSVNTVTETWEKKGTYRNGYLLNFALSIRDSFVEKPEHYSAEAVKAIEEGYSKAEDTGNVSEKPVIIAIMDESFADLGAMGNLKTNQEVMPFISSLKENAIYGKALASVYGAKTPNSEWEFMTGNSMAWLPSGKCLFHCGYFKRPGVYLRGYASLL